MNDHLLEMALQRLIVLNILAILPESGRSNALQLPTSQRRNEKLSETTLPQANSASTNVCSSSMKRMQSWLERISSRIVLKRSLTSLAEHSAPSQQAEEYASLKGQN
jgi:hypothetical protein